MRKYLRLYKSSIYMFFLNLSLYIVVMFFFLFFLDRTPNADDFLEKSMSIIFTALFLSLVLYNFPFMQMNFLQDLNFSIILPIRRKEILISRYIKDILLIVFTLALYYAFIYMAAKKLGADIIKFFDLALLYIFECLQLTFILQPIFIFASNSNKYYYNFSPSVSNKMSSLYTNVLGRLDFSKLFMIALYLFLPFILIFPAVFLLKNTTKGDYIFYFGAFNTKNILIMSIYTLILFIASFLSSYKLITKKEL